MLKQVCKSGRQYFLAGLIYDSSSSSRSGRRLWSSWLDCLGWPVVGHLGCPVILQQIRVVLFSWWWQDSKENHARSPEVKLRIGKLTSVAFCSSSLHGNLTWKPSSLQGRNCKASLLNVWIMGKCRIGTIFADRFLINAVKLMFYILGWALTVFE